MNCADADMDEGAQRASKRKASSAELGEDDAERLRLSSSPEVSNADMPTDSPARQSFVEAQRAEWKRHAEAEVENLMISSAQAVRAVKVGSTFEEESLTQDYEEEGDGNIGDEENWFDVDNENLENSAEEIEEAIEQHIVEVL